MKLYRQTVSKPKKENQRVAMPGGLGQSEKQTAGPSQRELAKETSKQTNSSYENTNR
jgi:hypothetical protein